MVNDPITNFTKTFEKHLSIRKIKVHMHLDFIFSFDVATRKN